jgi:hypothetical protein
MIIRRRADRSAAGGEVRDLVNADLFDPGLSRAGRDSARSPGRLPLLGATFGGGKGGRAFEHGAVGQRVAVPTKR